LRPAEAFLTAKILCVCHLAKVDGTQVRMSLPADERV
jgi:hypothetical protein